MSGARRVRGRLRGGVVEAKVSELRLWPDNPRTITRARLESLMRSMVDDPEMLWERPLVALLDRTVVLGNQRLRGAVELGWSTIPVSFVDLEPARAKK